MKLKKLDPFSREAVDLVVDKIRNMSREELTEALTYRPPGVEETDMTGMLNGHKARSGTPQEKPTGGA